MLVPLTGNGSDASPYRPSFPPGIEKIPGSNWSAHIPSKADGSPQYPDAYVCFPAGFKFPPGLTALPPVEVAKGVLARDPKADLKWTNVPPAIIKASWQDYLNRAYRLVGKYLGIAYAWAASATDNFTGTGALSSNWSTGYSPESAPTRVSDAAECAIGVRCVASYNAMVPDADQYAQGVITQYQTDTNGGDVGPAVRMEAPSTFSGYFARCGSLTTGTVSTLIQKRISGIASTVGTETASLAWAFGDLSRLEIVGGTLTVYRNGTPVATGPADGTLLLSGRGGMMINSANATDGSDISRLDDFEVGDLGVVTPTAGVRRRVVIVQ